MGVGSGDGGAADPARVQCGRRIYCGAVRCKDGADEKMCCSSQAPFVMVETSNCRVRADMEGINLSN